MFNFQTNIFNQKTILPMKVFKYSLVHKHRLWFN